VPLVARGLSAARDRRAAAKRFWKPVEVTR
jgi:hypothetical protein